MARCLVAIAVLIGALGAASAGTSATTTAIVDRTWSCALHTSDGFRLLSVGGARGFVDIPNADASMNVIDKLAPSPRDHLLGADWRGMRVSRSCRAAPRIPLSRKGLPGPPDLFATSYDCELKPKTVLIRIKAVVQAQGTWRPDPPAHLQLMKPISRAELVVQAPGGKRFGYATIAGKDFRLWVSPDCVRD